MLSLQPHDHPPVINAVHDAINQPLIPLQDQSHGPDHITEEGFPAEQRSVEGAEANVCPSDAPHTPSIAHVPRHEFCSHRSVFGLYENPGLHHAHAAGLYTLISTHVSFA